MSSFEFAYRKAGKIPRPWRKVRVKGFIYDEKLNRCFLFLPEEQGRIEVPGWHEYEVKLGADWVRAEEADRRPA